MIILAKPLDLNKLSLIRSYEYSAKHSAFDERNEERCLKICEWEGKREILQMELKQEKIYTVKDIYALPEGQRSELIDGKMYDMAPPSRVHQKLLSEMHYKIRDYIAKNNGNCEVYPAPFAVFLNENDGTYVEPDISVICDKDKLDDQGCNGAPDWIIEITSPSSQSMDYKIKLFKYRSAGVREYWIVNPRTRTTQVYDFERDSGNAQYTFDEDVPVGIYEGFSLRISDML